MNNNIRNMGKVVDDITEKIQDMIGAEKLSDEEIAEVLDGLKAWLGITIKTIRKED